MANLQVRICGLEFSNPILPAAGPPSKDGAMLQAAAKGGAGGLVTKTISVNPAEVPRPCMAEIKGGFLNTELWSELPKEQWLETEYKLARSTGLPVIVADDPLTCVVRGSGKALEKMDKLGSIFTND